MSVVLAALDFEMYGRGGRGRQEMARQRRGWRWMTREQEPLSLQAMTTKHLFYCMRYLQRKVEGEGRSLFTPSPRGMSNRPVDRRAWSFLVMFEDIILRQDLDEGLINSLAFLVQQVLGNNYLSNYIDETNGPNQDPARLNTPFDYSFSRSIAELTGRDDVVRPPLHANARSQLLPTDVLERYANRDTETAREWQAQYQNDPSAIVPLSSEADLLRERFNEQVEQMAYQMTIAAGVPDVTSLLTTLDNDLNASNFASIGMIVQTTKSFGIQHEILDLLEQDAMYSDQEAVGEGLVRLRILLTQSRDILNEMDQPGDTLRSLAEAFGGLGSTADHAGDSLRHAVDTIIGPRIQERQDAGIIMDDPLAEVEADMLNQSEWYGGSFEDKTVETLTQIGKRKIVIDEEDK